MCCVLCAGFDFQERGLTQWARQRAETVAQDDEAKFQQRLQAYLAANDLPAAITTAATASTDITDHSDNSTVSVVDSKPVSGWNVRLKRDGSSTPKSRSVSSRESMLVAAGSAGAVATAAVPKADASTQVHIESYSWLKRTTCFCAAHTLNPACTVPCAHSLALHSIR
jgi:hypothetical protein